MGDDVKLTPAQERLLVEVCDGVMRIFWSYSWGYRSALGSPKRQGIGRVADNLISAGMLTVMRREMGTISDITPTAAGRRRRAAIKAREQGK
ncbi:hypothetical protein ACFOGJ_16015 [Marinibaculum pumilum]|uniref:Uncharacterized protein n=1 Tax=Marinibaculum pumilum TaxID=1766165 RepID=A0ABV7L2X1_9PROT